MVDAPEKIWADVRTCTVYMDGSSPITARDREFRNSTEYTRSDLVAELAAQLAGKVKVKPLEWVEGVVDWAKPLPGMKYVACGTTPAGSWAFWLEEAPETRAVFSSEAEAKAAAQADYERRILSALVPSH